MRELLIAYTIKSRKKSVNKERYHTIFASAIHDLNNEEKNGVSYTRTYVLLLWEHLFCLLDQLCVIHEALDIRRGKR